MLSHLFCRTASSYDIRFSANIKQLRHSFESASQLNDGDIVSGNLSSPLTSSETEVIMIRFPAGDKNRTLFFGLKVNHGSGRISEVSNIVSVALMHKPLETRTTSHDHTYSRNIHTTLLTAVAGAVAMLTFLVIALRLIISARQRRRVHENKYMI